MSIVSKVVGGALNSVVGGLAGPGASAVTPYKVNAGAFTDPNEERRRKMLEGAKAGLATGGPAAGNVAGLISTLQNRVAGASPSVAATQLARTTDANKRAALGLAASGAPGGNPALALRTAINAGTQANQEAAGQGALLRATEQTQAEQTLGQAVQTQAGEEQARNTLIAQYTQMGLSADQAAFQAQQDLERLKSANYNAAHGITAQGEIANQQARTGVVGGIVGGVGAGLGAALSDKRVKMKVRPAGDKTREMLEHYADGGPILPDVGGPAPMETDPRNRVEAILARMGYGSGGMDAAMSAAGTAKNLGGLLAKLRPDVGGVAAGIKSGAGSAAHMEGGGPVRGPGGPREDRVPILASNGENVWSAEDVSNAGGQGGVEGLKDLLGAVHAKRFAYKGEGPGAEHVGVMAQDLEKSPLGRTMVLDTPDGKMVDNAMVLPAVLAAAAELNRRVDALERRKGGGR